MIHTEAERQFYLGVAGVRLWYARSPLPGAAPSPDFEFPEEVPSSPEEHPAGTEPTAQVAPSVTRQPSGKSAKPARSVNLQSLMETSAPESSGTTATPSSAGSEPEAEQVAGAAANEPRRSVDESKTAPFRQKLNLRLWVGRRFVLVSDLSGEASLRLQETLAGNILKSVGDQEARELGSVLWPVFNNPLIPGNRLADVIDVLRGVLEPVESQQVIVLGVPDSGDQSGPEHWFSEALGRKPELVFPHTLAELAGNPELKKKLWQLLKPFA